LGHELTHFYFNVNGLKEIFPNRETEEQCCDLAVFLLGLGKLIMNSFAEKATHAAEAFLGTIKEEHYLPWYFLCYIYEKINMLNKIPQSISIKNLNSTAIKMLSAVRQHDELFKVQDAFKSGSEPNGFRDIKWGTDIRTLPDMEYVTTDSSYGGIREYIKKNDELKIGDAVL